MSDAPLPIRLRLSRAKGFDLQLMSRAANGLPARSVARPGPFGNPFAHRTREMAARTHRSWLLGTFRTSEMFGCTCKWSQLGLAALRRDTMARLPELRGHNLACWCPLPADGQPDYCHAAVLLEVANG